MAKGQRPRSDAGMGREPADLQELVSPSERLGTKKAVCGMLLRCINLVEQGRWEQAERLLGTVGAFIETVTDPQGDQKER